MNKIIAARQLGLPDLGHHISVTGKGYSEIGMPLPSVKPYRALLVNIRAVASADGVVAGITLSLSSDGASWGSVFQVHVPPHREVVVYEFGTEVDLLLERDEKPTTAGRTHCPVVPDMTGMTERLRERGL